MNTTNDLKTILPKRLLAWFIDTTLMVTLILAFALLFSSMMQTDSYGETFEERYAHYEGLYGVDFDISEEQYNALSEEELARYNEAYSALTSDPEVSEVYNRLYRRALTGIELSFLLSYLIIDFLLPLLFKNGQTIGKRLLGLAVTRRDGSQVSTITLLSRTVLGKFVLEALIPVMVVFSFFFSSIGLISILFVAAILIANIVLLFKKGTQLHDLMADTMVVMRNAAPARHVGTESIGQKAKLPTANIDRQKKPGN